MQVEDTPRLFYPCFGLLDSSHNLILTQTLVTVSDYFYQVNSVVDVAENDAKPRPITTLT